ncbi:MAG: hypothetical protein GF401_07690 [Chitinivibrionales bacterium]|nr:hypothetical protein [Chitinivibrionales bacterium]
MINKKSEYRFTRVFHKALLALPLVVGMGALIGYGKNNDETISTDTVTVTDVQRHITGDDTGAFKETFNFSMPAVKMSHIGHEKGGVTECITCHHKHDNDDRIKECAQCHKGVEGMEIMHENCGVCHKENNISTDCRSCHKEEKKERRFLFGIPSSQAQLHNVTFSHVRHHPREEECQRCHTTTDNTKRFYKSANYPLMEECLTCHDNKKAPENCAVCHGDSDTLMPRSHANRWLCRGGHGMEANFDKQSCLQCHQEMQCNQCHRGQADFKIHPAGYRFSHGMDVKTGKNNCTMCHETRSMCARCHERR